MYIKLRKVLQKHSKRLLHALERRRSQAKIEHISEEAMERPVKHIILAKRPWRDLSSTAHSVGKPWQVHAAIKMRTQGGGTREFQGTCFGPA